MTKVFKITYDGVVQLVAAPSKITAIQVYCRHEGVSMGSFDENDTTEEIPFSDWDKTYVNILNDKMDSREMVTLDYYVGSRAPNQEVIGLKYYASDYGLKYDTQAYKVFLNKQTGGKLYPNYTETFIDWCLENSIKMGEDLWYYKDEILTTDKLADKYLQLQTPLR